MTILPRHPPRVRGGTPAYPTFGKLPVRAGVGLKPQHFQAIVETVPDIGFFEIHAENYLVAGGPFHHYLDQIRARYSLSIHGVGMSIGAEGALDRDHLTAVRNLVDRYEPAVFSEHLAWSTHKGHFYNDLLPVPYDSEALARVCHHIDEVQNFLRRPILLENPSTYVEFARSSYREEDFISEIVRRTGCGLLLDVNNVYVSCVNHGRVARDFLAALPLESVVEIHLAGFSRQADTLGQPLLIDSHGSRVDAEVWALYDWMLARTGALPTLIEWDNDVPTLDILLAEACHADARLAPPGRGLERSA